jgi:hypothetical protein
MNREDFDFHDVHHSIAESVVTENYISKITNTFMSIALHMKDVSISANSIIEMLSKYAMKYRIPTSSFEKLQGFLDLTFKGDVSTTAGHGSSFTISGSMQRSGKEKGRFRTKLKNVFGGMLKSREAKEEEELRRRTFVITGMDLDQDSFIQQNSSPQGSMKKKTKPQKKNSLI